MVTRRTKDRRRSQGLCPVCGLINDRLPKVICSICHSKKNSHSIVWREKRLKEGLCFRCSNVLDLPDISYCSTCKEKKSKQ